VDVVGSKLYEISFVTVSSGEIDASALDALHRFFE
jgi:hypothetical protein